MEGVKKWVITLVLSAPGLFMKLQWLFIVIMFGFLLDFVTAFLLNRRLRKKGLSSGKFSSKKFFGLISKFISCMSGIIFCYIIDEHILTDIQEIHIANWLTFVICIGTAISILENITTENPDPLALLVQKVLVSKVEKHLEVDIHSGKNVEAGEDIADVADSIPRRRNGGRKGHGKKSDRTYLS